MWVSTILRNNSPMKAEVYFENEIISNIKPLYIHIVYLLFFNCSDKYSDQVSLYKVLTTLRLSGGWSPWCLNKIMMTGRFESSHVVAHNWETRSYSGRVASLWNLKVYFQGEELKPISSKPSQINLPTGDQLFKHESAGDIVI